MSSNHNDDDPNYKYYYLPQRIGPGSLPNNRVPTCDVCRENGYPHESVIAKTLPNNTIRIVNYFDGSEHVHKDVSDDPHAWATVAHYWKIIK